MDYERLTADRTANMGASAIREILKALSVPGMISLAGGIPSPESFPMDVMEELSVKVIRRYGPRAFQYDLTEGFLPLREALAAYLPASGLRPTPEDIIITSGSQGLLEMTGKILISRGDRVAVESPTYLGALQAFSPYEPSYVTMRTDEDGLIPESLEEVVDREPVKFVYLVPTFQNPTGRTISLERRHRIAQIVRERDILVLEDDPYGMLRYSGVPLPSLKSLVPDNVIYAGSFSKILAPGLRVGFCIAPAQIRKWLVIAKQGIDLHTGTFSQALAAEYLSGGYLTGHLPKILALYAPRRDAMLEALQAYFPGEFSFSRPEGGMFIWAEGPPTFDIRQVYEDALRRLVAFVPGRYFFARPDEGLSSMRLNFTCSTAEDIRKAVRILGEITGAHLARHRAGAAGT